jgi:glycosyltransferase involved in cell wall biosynthesis
MVTFIISIKHYTNSHSYENTWKLLENTLDSINNQTDSNYNIIVVSNKTLRDYPGVKFIELDWDAPTINDDWQMHSNLKIRAESSQMKNIRLDRGTKHVIALREARRITNDDHFVMFVDGDDFIHKDVALFANNNLHADIIRVFDGIKLGVNNTYKFRDRFNSICGTCNIVKINTIADPINFGIIQNDTQEEVLESIDDYYLKMILGSHKFVYEHFVEDRGLLGLDIPFPAAVYNCSHNEQHSGRSNLKLPLKLTELQIKNFNIKYI